MREIQVRFNGSYTDYSYFTEDQTVKVSDEVVVITPTETKVARVVAVDTKTGKATKPIVCKVDKTGYAIMATRITAKRDLDKKIKERVKKLSETMLLDLLSERDCELASLLKAQKSL